MGTYSQLKDAVFPNDRGEKLLVDLHELFLH